MRTWLRYARPDGQTSNDRDTVQRRRSPAIQIFALCQNPPRAQSSRSTCQIFINPASTSTAGLRVTRAPGLGTYPPADGTTGGGRRKTAGTRVWSSSAPLSCTLEAETLSGALLEELLMMDQDFNLLLFHTHACERSFQGSQRTLEATTIFYHFQVPTWSLRPYARHAPNTRRMFDLESNPTAPPADTSDYLICTSSSVPLPRLGSVADSPAASTHTSFVFLYLAIYHQSVR